jgi:hypothetical protein
MPLRTALSPLEHIDVPPDSARAFEGRLAAALAAGPDSLSMLAADVVARRLEEAGLTDVWNRLLFTFVTSGIVDPVDLAVVCDGLEIDRILHLEVGDVVERRPVHAHRQVMLAVRVELRAWMFDCGTAQLAWERWAEGEHDIVLSGSVDATRSLLMVGAVSKAIDVLLHSPGP